MLVEEGGGWTVHTLCATPVGQEAFSAALSGIVKETSPGIIAVDMPVSDLPVCGCREADRATTRAFSRFGCPVHSPNPERPGQWGWAAVKSLHEAGYRCLTRPEDGGQGFAEVYPHTALLKLLRLRYRFPYKTGRSGIYWPADPLPLRKQKLLRAFLQMHRALEKEFGTAIPTTFPKMEDSLYIFKQTEDLLDALVCGWCAIQIQQGRFEPFGDSCAAIWNPPLKELDLHPPGV